MSNNIKDALARAQHQQDAWLNQLGVTYHREEIPVTDDEGNPVIDPATGKPKVRISTIISNVPKDVQDTQEFFDLSKPCNFPGCEDLRREYTADLEAIGGENCTTCAKGAVIRKYQSMLLAQMRKVKPSHITVTGTSDDGVPIVHYTPNSTEESTSRNNEPERIATGTEELSVPTGTSQKGTEKRKSLLRSAAGYLAKVFSALSEEKK